MQPHHHGKALRIRRNRDIEIQTLEFVLLERLLVRVQIVGHHSSSRVCREQRLVERLAERALGLRTDGSATLEQAGRSNVQARTQIVSRQSSWDMSSTVLTA